jgi:glucokinase
VKLKMGIGIDIGGTNIVIGLVSPRGAVVDSTTIATNATAPFEEVKGPLFTAVDKLLGANIELMGIGIGCAGPLDVKEGIIHNPYTLPGWKEVPICSFFEKRYNCKVRLENDADCALLGEIFVREEKVENVVMLTFGTGVGGSVLLNGHLFKNDNFGHPELGHIVVAPGEGVCYCGGDGCLESVASGTALSKKAQVLGYQDFHDLVKQGGLLSEGQAIVEEWSKHVSQALWTLVHIFSPSLILFAGGVVEGLFEVTKTQIVRFLERGHFYSDITLERAVLGINAGVVGAASLILSDYGDND